MSLFTREGRRMVATPMTKIFAAEVGLSFDRLAVAAEACGRPGARRILRVLYSVDALDALDEKNTVPCIKPAHRAYWRSGVDVLLTFVVLGPPSKCSVAKVAGS